jgi:nitrilase
MCSSASPEKNLEQCKLAFEAASNQSSDLLVLPENFLAMGARFNVLIETDWEAYIEALGDLARNYHLPCIAGTIPVEDPQHAPKRFARSIFFNAHGEVIDSYDKLHLFDVDVGDEKGAYRESKYYSPGSEPKLVQLADAKIGMTICFDLRFPSLFQIYREMGANIIVVPSAFTALTGQKHWEILLRSRAVETQCFVVAPNQVGTHDDGRKTWGHSLLIGPDGEVLLDMGEQVGVSTVELDLDTVFSIRKSMPLNSFMKLK